MFGCFFNHAVKARVGSFFREDKAHIADKVSHALVYFVGIVLEFELSLEDAVEEGDGRLLFEKSVFVV